jgi:hypothetical protein
MLTVWLSHLISHSSSVPVSHSLQVLLPASQLIQSAASGGGPMESLQSHCIHTQFHWSSGPPVCFLSWGTRVQSPGGYSCETGIFLLVLSRYNFMLSLDHWVIASRLCQMFCKDGHLQFKSAPPQYCGQTNQLRSCVLKKVVELQLRAFKILLPQFLNYPQSPASSLLSSPFSSTQDGYKNQPNMYLELSVCLETKNLS